MTEQLTKPQRDLLDQLEAGDLGDVEFTELALEAGMSIGRIEKALQESREGWE